MSGPGAGPEGGGGPGAAGVRELGAADLDVLGARELRRSDPPQAGPYRVLARLGGGGMGRLYLAREATLTGPYQAGSLVAVKVIRPEYAEDERFRRRFSREIEAVRRVHGTYTAVLLGHGFEDDELLWMATAYVPGPSLADAVARAGPLPPASVWRLAYEIAQALTAIAAAGIVHRDLKPSNVVLGPDGARVIDFGVAHTADASALTMTGQQLGTPAFMSPEQAEGRPVGTPSDVFSLGSVLALAATGSPPFGEDSTGGTVHRVIHAPPRDEVLAELARQDPAMAETVSRCLDKDPARRPSPQDVADTARARAGAAGPWPEPAAGVIRARAGWAGRAVTVPVADQETVLRRAPVPDAGPPARVRRRRPLIAAAGVTAVAAAAATALLVPGGGSGQHDGSGTTRAGATAAPAPVTSSGPPRAHHRDARAAGPAHPSSAATPRPGPTAGDGTSARTSGGVTGGAGAGSSAGATGAATGGASAGVGDAASGGASAGSSSGGAARTAPPPATTPAAPAPARSPAVSRSCGGWSHRDPNPGTYGYMAGTFHLDAGPYANCPDVVLVRSGQMVWYHCCVSNAYGHRWWYVRIAGTHTAGWMSADNLRGQTGPSTRC
ncbi:serine/threonine-protein kinase [Streptomyces sp. NPDC020983]|uniref:serine/threonine-protein kinase n=1 Tax=Streptomyces sp. NPDC020983 TaxID=3365106 RepID=UPI0037AFBC77